jgi:dihydrofolate reductase
MSESGKLALIVAIGRGGVIGHDSGLPWRQSADLQRFKRVTMGHPIIMGRHTHESIGKALPGRDNIVLSRSTGAALPAGCGRATSIEEALGIVGDEPAFVIGGGQIYRDMLPLVSRIFVTFVDGDVEGDTFFPEVDWSAWSLLSHDTHPADEKNQFPMTFMDFSRRGVACL